MLNRLVLLPPTYLPFYDVPKPIYNLFTYPKKITQDMVTMTCPN
jgi:hypothetical protein